jgi:hypothetical protein
MLANTSISAFAKHFSYLPPLPINLYSPVAPSLPLPPSSFFDFSVSTQFSSASSFSVIVL